MNHDDLGNYSHSYVADLRARLKAANERAEKAAIAHGGDLALMRDLEQQVADVHTKLAASEQTSAALKAEVDRLLHERNEIAEKSVLPYRDQLNALVREAEKVVVERDAARALNDTLAGAAQEAHAALVSIRADRPTAHTDEVWFMLNRAINTTDAALSAYAKSKEAAK